MNTLIKPIITEKTIVDAQNSKYTFEVIRKTNKALIAKEIETNYKVKVKKVNILINKAEEKIIKGRYKGKTKAVKKAIISLGKNQKIAGFEIKK